jgi:N-acetylneuraminic acid mutarotase
MSQGREGNAGTVVDGRFLVYGGYNSSHVPDGGYLRSLESYDPVMDIWTAKSSGEPRRDFGFTAIYDLAYAMGGNNVARSLDLAYAYDFVADSWTLKTPLPSGMDYVRSETIGSKVYVFGTANTYEYTPLNDIR